MRFGFELPQQLPFFVGAQFYCAMSRGGPPLQSPSKTELLHDGYRAVTELPRCERILPDFDVHRNRFEPVPDVPKEQIEPDLIIAPVIRMVRPMEVGS